MGINHVWEAVTSTRPHRYLERSQRTKVVFEEGQDALLSRTTTVYIYI